MKNSLKINIKKYGFKFLGLIASLLFSVSAYASTTSEYPWAQTLQNIMNSMDGPVAYSCAGIAVVMAGLSMAFMDLQGGARKFIQAALGISLAFGAVTLLSTFFNFSGAVVI